MVLEYFGEEPVKFDDAKLCCDVCAGVSSQPMVNCLPEMQAIVRVVKELPSLGEIKVIFHAHVQQSYVVMTLFNVDSPVDPWFRTATNHENTRF